MISAAELILIKSRLLLAADAAHRIATSADPVRYEQGEYEQVYGSLVAVRQDISRVLAELDVLRGMFHTNVAMWLTEEAANVGLPIARTDVGPVPAPEAGGSGEGKPEERAGADGGVPKGRVLRKRAKRSKPGANPGGDGKVPEPVGSGD